MDCKASGSDIDQHGTHVAGTAARLGSSRVAARIAPLRRPRPPADLVPDARTRRPRPGAAARSGCSAAGEAPISWWMPSACRPGRRRRHPSLSLGSSFGDPGSIDAVAVDNASLAGVTVVASSGNSGQSAYITGTPGVATRAISVAALDALPSFKAARITT
ncbi:MAG: S8 family serine peptidase [Chloroflexota bacterium]